MRTTLAFLSMVAMIMAGCTVVTPTPTATPIPTPSPTPTATPIPYPPGIHAARPTLVWMPTPTKALTPIPYPIHEVVLPTPTPVRPILPPVSIVLQPLGANVVLHEDFEAPVVGGRWRSIDGGQVNGWTVEGVVDITGTFWQAARGRQSLDLHGWDPGAIVREFAVIPEQSYELCFAVSGNPTGGDSVKVLEVWWDATLVDRIAIDTTGRSPSHMGWVYRKYRLTPHQESARLKFQGVGGGSHWGPVIDDIRIVIGSGGCGGETQSVSLPTPTPIPTQIPSPTPTVTLAPTVVATSTPTIPVATPTSTPTPTIPPATPTPTSTPMPTATPTPLLILPGARMVSVAANVDLLPGEPVTVQVVLNNPSERELERILVWRFVTKRGDARLTMRMLPGFVELPEGRVFSIPEGETIILGIISVPSGVAPFQIQQVFVDVKTGSGTLIESLLTAQNVRVPETLEPSSPMKLQFVRVDAKEFEAVFSGSLKNAAGEEQAVRLQVVSCSFKKGRTTILVDGVEKSLSAEVTIAQRSTVLFEVRIEPEESIVQVPQCTLSFQRVLKR